MIHRVDLIGPNSRHNLNQVEADRESDLNMHVVYIRAHCVELSIQQEVVTCAKWS